MLVIITYFSSPIGHFEGKVEICVKHLVFPEGFEGFGGKLGMHMSRGCPCNEYF